MHTPGPWFYWNEGSTICVQAKCDDFHKVVVNWPGFDGCGFPVKQQKENAKLIAAAPDLLAACDAAETMLRCLPDTSTNANGTKPNMTTILALKLVRAAMQKAKSGASA